MTQAESSLLSALRAAADENGCVPIETANRLIEERFPGVIQHRVIRNLSAHLAREGDRIRLHAPRRATVPKPPQKSIPSVPRPPAIAVRTPLEPRKEPATSAPEQRAGPREMRHRPQNAQRENGAETNVRPPTMEESLRILADLAEIQRGLRHSNMGIPQTVSTAYFQEIWPDINRSKWRLLCLAQRPVWIRTYSGFGGSLIDIQSAGRMALQNSGIASTLSEDDISRLCSLDTRFKAS
jgi:hypothetical protein